jgi:hypothetical protein
MILFDFDLKVEKTGSDGEERLGELQFAAKVGQQERGEKKSQAGFREKMERATVLIQELGTDALPILFSLERQHFVGGFAALTAAQEIVVARVNVAFECGDDELGGAFSGGHVETPRPSCDFFGYNYNDLLS